MAQSIEITLYESPEAVLALDGDQAGQRAVYRVLDKRPGRPLPMRSEPDWEIEAQREHWARLAVEVEDAGDALVLCRETIRELDAELERRKRLAYQRAESPYDWPELLERIKARADLLAVIGARRPDSVWGRGIRTTGRVVHLRCPFHLDGTPSLAVYTDEQHYHCFGCGATGDAIDAVQALDGLTFVQAAEALANEFGIELPKPERPTKFL